MNPPAVRRSELLRGFDQRYLQWSVPLRLVCLLSVAWHWSQPGAHNQGAPLIEALQLPAAEAALLNLPSSWLQRRTRDFFRCRVC